MFGRRMAATGGLALAAAALLCLPSTSSAQFFFGFGRGGLGISVGNRAYSPWYTGYPGWGYSSPWSGYYGPWRGYTSLSPWYYGYGWNYPSAYRYSTWNRGYPTNYRYYSWNYQPAYTTTGYFDTSGYAGMTGSYMTPTYQTFGTPSAITPVAFDTPMDNRVHISTVVPPNAEVYFEGTRTQQEGTFREFVSPPLSPGKYTYDIRVQWMENGVPVVRQRQLEVRPGEQYTLNFLVPPTAGGDAATPAQFDTDQPFRDRDRRSQPYAPSRTDPGAPFDSTPASPSTTEPRRTPTSPDLNGGTEATPGATPTPGSRPQGTPGTGGTSGTGGTTGSDR